MNTEQLNIVPKDQIATLAKTLNKDDIQFLVGTLSEKDDKLRYNAFLLLQAHSREKPSVYGYWDVLEQKLDSDNSYQRSLGVMLISENVRWDKEGKFSKIIGKFMARCNDEKFITARQTIQGIETIVKTTDKYNQAFEQGVSGLQLSQYKENQQRLLKKDIANTLKIIKNQKS